MPDIVRNKTQPKGRHSPRSGPGGFASDSWNDADDEVGAAMSSELTTKDIPLTLPNYSLQPRNRPADFLLFRREKFDLDAPYQRSSVWGLDRRQNLLRSLLMGLPVGSIILNKRYGNSGVNIVSELHPESTYGIVDGKQRVETLRAMADGEFGIPAEWVREQFRGALVPIEYGGSVVPGVRVTGEGHPFNSLLHDFPISTIEAEVKTIEEEAEIFLLINTGGVEQTADGLENAKRVAGA